MARRHPLAHATLIRFKERIDTAKAAGEIDRSVDSHGLARFVQTVQNGISLIARDGARLDELAAVVDMAMLGWDARLRQRPHVSGT